MTYTSSLEETRKIRKARVDASVLRIRLLKEDLAEEERLLVDLVNDLNAVCTDIFRARFAGAPFEKEVLP